MPRVNYVDFVKGMAIIAVVFGHISCFGNYPLLPVGSLFAYTWHMGVFFLVAGFFLEDVDKGNVKAFIKKKIKQLYLLALYFYLPAVLLHNGLLQIGWYATDNPVNGKVMEWWNVGEYAKQILLTICCAGREPIVSAMWFVYVLFFAMIGYAIISLIVNRFGRQKQRRDEWLLLSFFILAVISGILSNKFGITIHRCSNVFTAMMLIYTGKYMYQKLKMGFDNGLLAIASAVMLYEVAVMSGSVYLNENMFPDMAVLIAGCLSALYLIAYIGKRIGGSVVERLVRYCGRESFYIMALHLVGFKLCTMMLSVVDVHCCRLSDLGPRVGNNIFLLLLYLAFGVLFPLGFIWMIRKLIWLIPR